MLGKLLTLGKESATVTKLADVNHECWNGIPLSLKGHLAPSAQSIGQSKRRLGKILQFSPVIYSYWDYSKLSAGSFHIEPGVEAINDALSPKRGAVFASVSFLLLRAVKIELSTFYRALFLLSWEHGFDLVQEAKGVGLSNILTAL